MKSFFLSLCLFAHSFGHGLAADHAPVVAWGKNVDGQTSVPEDLTNVIAIEAGVAHTVALKRDGTVVTWGARWDNNRPENLRDVNAVSAGAVHTVALKSDGTVVAWGTSNILNNHGQADVPSGLRGVIAIAAGDLHTLALKADGSVVAWGDWVYGQMNNMPVGPSSLTAIAAGATHSVALKEDGTVVAWGGNGSGKTDVPAGLSGVTAIAAGDEHTVALKGDGTVVVWGANNLGQRNVPADLNSVIAIAAGRSHTAALKSDGTVVAWGANEDGQASVPVGLSGVTAIAAGGGHTIALSGNNNFSLPLEARSRDLGAVAKGFDNNFALGTFILGNARYQLVDLVRDTPRMEPECIYASWLIVPRNATLDLNGLKVYARIAKIEGTVINGTISQIADSGVLTMNTPVLGTLIGAGESDEWTFFARAGSNVTIAAEPGGTLVADPALGYIAVNLLDSADNVIASRISAAVNETVLLSNISLPADGHYRVRINAPPAHIGSIGNYRLAVWEVTPNNEPLVLNQQSSGRIETPYSTDSWTFSASAGQQVQFDLINVSAQGVVFTLRGPNDWIGFENLSSDSDLVSLPASGSYVLTATGTGGAFDIAYAFRMVETLQTNIEVGTLLTGELSGSGQAQIFRLELTSGGPLELLLLNSGSGNRLEIYASRGTPPTRGSYEVSSASGTGANRSLLIPSASEGVWYVLVYADKVLTPGSFSLEATKSGVALTGLTPGSQATNASATLTVSGAGFRSGMTVELVSGSGTAVAASRVTLDSYTQLTVGFAPNSLAPGAYSLRVRRENGDVAQLPGAFISLPAGEGKLDTKLILPGAFGRHAVATIYVEYSNIGTAAMPAPLLVLKSSDPDGSDRPILTLDESRIVQNFWSGTAGLPPGTSHEVYILASGAQPGVLNPGERFKVPVHFMGLLQPWDTADDRVEMEIRHWTANDPSPFDWAPRKETLRPPTLAPEIWDVVFANLITGLTTTADYVRMLSDNAQFLGRQGLRVVDVDDLWMFEVQQAYGYSALPVLDSATDASVATPGIPLALARQFSSNLRSRNAAGPFGQGWFTSWQTRMVVERNGDLVKVIGEAGSARLFSRDTRKNSYFSGAGDSSQLAAVSGSYELRQPNGTVTRFRADGFTDYLQDANGNRVSATWAGGRLTALSHTSGASISLTYGANGFVSSVADSSGRSMAYTYNGPYLISATTDDGKVTSYTYETVGAVAGRHALASVTRAGIARHFTWDARGRLESSWLADGEEMVQFGYDSAGGVTVSQAGGITSLFFEHHGLLAKVVDPLGNITQSEFDKDLRLHRLVLPTGESKSFTWCNCGSPTSITDELGNVTRFAYDHPLKKMTRFTDAKGNVTRYVSDQKGNLLDTIYADNSVERLAGYTAEGFPQTQTNRRGQAIGYTWTASGKVERQTFADGSYNRFDYDSRDNLTQVTEHPATGPDKITTYTYTHATDGDRLKKVDYPDGKWVEYFYETSGRRSRMTDSAGGDSRYEYDIGGRLWKLRDDAEAVIAEYLYDAAGRLLRINKGNGTYTTYQYDLVGQILHLINHAPNGAPNSRFDYTYDSRGRRTSMDTLDGKWTYSYDATGQLVHAVFASTNPEIANQDLRYNYDPLGNRVSTILNGVTTQYVPNSLNQYTSVGGVGQQYDADGNLVFDGENTLEYDIQNRLVRVVGSHGTTEYEYNALGNRTLTVTNGERTQYLLDPTGLVNVLEERFETNGSRNYTYGLGLTACSLSGGELREYFDFDGIGSVAGISLAGGNLGAGYSYSPFGATIHTFGFSNSFQLSGQFGLMVESGKLSFARARFLSAPTGRFVSKDPVEMRSGQFNYYSYANNDPINYIDPTGLAREGYDAKRQTFKDIYNIFKFARTWDWDSFVDVVENSNFRTTLDYVAEVLHKANSGLSDWLSGRDSSGRESSDGGNGNGGNGNGGNGNGGNGNGGNGNGGNGNGGNGNGGNGGEWNNGSGDGYGGGGDGQSGSNGGSRNSSAFDPNEKIGPGLGAQGWVKANALLPYRINFENLGPGSVDANGDPYATFATAPAQRVMVTDQLDEAFDWTSFELTEFGFGDTIVQVPAGQSHYAGSVSMTYNDQTFDVEIEAGLDFETGRVSVRFQSITPGTGLPPDVLTGMLPPEDGTGRGMGHLSYTIRSKADLPHNREIRNIAFIKFDGNEVIATNQVDPQDASKGTDPDKEALVTIDSTPPVSSVTVLPAKNRRTFAVSWSGTDEGSGIRQYHVYVSANDGAFMPWLTTSSTGASFEGVHGVHYAFYSVAEDQVGNLEEKSAAPETGTDALRFPPEALLVGMPFSLVMDSDLQVTKVSGLPAGLAYDTKTRTISGRATKPGTKLVTVSIRGQDGKITLEKFEIAVDALPAHALGSFVAVLDRNETTGAGLGGMMTLQVTAAGSASGQLTLAGKRHPFKGQVTTVSSSEVFFETSISRGKTVAGLNLHLDLGTDDLLVGKVEDGNVETNLRGWRVVWHVKTKAASANEVPPAWLGRINMLMDHASLPWRSAATTAPQGIGFASFTLTNLGAVKLAGRHLDGTTLALSSSLGPDGQLALWVPLYKNTGSVIMTADLDAEGRLSGTGDAVRKAQGVKEKLYREGFGHETEGETPGPVPLALAGGRWSVPKAAPIMQLPYNPLAPAANAWLEVSDGGIKTDTVTETPNLVLTITDKNKVLPGPSNPASVKLTVAPATGLVGGSLVLRDVTVAGRKVARTVKVYGLSVPALDGAVLGGGVFALPQLSDSTRILTGRIMLKKGGP